MTSCKLNNKVSPPVVNNTIISCYKKQFLKVSFNNFCKRITIEKMQLANNLC